MAWIWDALGWGLALLGVGVVVWAVCWDRAGPHKRRLWGGVAVGVGLMVAAHAAVSVPAVRARGLVGGVPSVGLVGVMAVASDRAGPPDSGGAWRDGMLDELRTRVWGVGHPGAVDGWLARRLVFVLAKALPAELVTDQVTTRGRMFHSVVNGTMFRDRAYGFERAWSESVVWMGVEDRVVSPGTPVWAKVRVRRLVGGRYRVELGAIGGGDEGPVWFEAYSRDWGVTGPNPGPGMTEAQRRDAERGDQILEIGAGLFGVHGEGGPQAVVARFGDAGAVGQRVEVRPVRVLSRDGPIRGDGPWLLRHASELELAILVEEGAGPEPVASDHQAVRAAVEEVLVIEAFAYTRKTDGVRTLAIHTPMMRAPSLTRPVTIGGSMEVGFWRGVGDERAWVGLGSAGPGWWRLMPLPAGEAAEDWWWRADELLLAWPQEMMASVEWFEGEAGDQGLAGTEPVVLRVGVGNRDAAWADLGAERVFDGEVEIAMGMTAGEVREIRAGRSGE